MTRYKCITCKKQFQSKRRHNGISETLWKEYVEGKQTIAQLAEKYGRSHVWIRKQLDSVVIEEAEIEPQTAVFITDTTFWGRDYGVCVFRVPALKRNVWWNEVASERMAHYLYGKQILEEKGWTFSAVVVDGRRGFMTVFKGIPIQMCQFHQVKQVMKYLTKKPKTDAAKELRTVVLTLTKSDEATFTAALAAWHEKWSDFIEEKTVDTFLNGKKKWYFTHKKVRAAYRSLKTNLPYLFTYLKYPELNIPNTTNSLDGTFSPLKKKVAAHHGLSRKRRFRVISHLLKNGC